MNRDRNVDHESITQRKRLLGQKIQQRRAELDLTQESVAQLGGLSSETLRQYEVGKIPDRPTTRILESIDMALGWCLGSSKTVLASGAEPVVDGAIHPNTPATQRSTPAPSPARVSVDRGQLRQLVSLTTGLLSSAAHSEDPKELMGDLAALHRLATEMTLAAVI